MTEVAARHRFSVDEWHQMYAVFDDDARVELVEGDVVEMAPIGNPHAQCVNRLARLLFGRVGERAVVAVQNPVVVGAHTELQPDFALLVPPLERYTSLPGPADLYLVVEVAVTSLAYDLGPKAGLYARAGVPELWVVDVGGEAVVVHRRPSGAGYGSVSRSRRGETLSPVGLPGLELGVDDIFGPV